MVLSKHVFFGFYEETTLFKYMNENLFHFNIKTDLKFESCQQLTINRRYFGTRYFVNS